VISAGRVDPRGRASTTLTLIHTYTALADALDTAKISTHLCAPKTSIHAAREVTRTGPIPIVGTSSVRAVVGLSDSGWIGLSSSCAGELRFREPI